MRRQPNVSITTMKFTKIINQATLADLLSAAISCLTLVLAAGTLKAAEPSNWYENTSMSSIRPPAPRCIFLCLQTPRFTSATMLASGRAATLVQDATGEHITIPEAWAPLNTVIKLTAR